MSLPRLNPSLNAAWVFALALAVRMVVLGRFGHSAYFTPSCGDMKFYADWGRALATGWTGTHAYYGLPGYAFLLDGLFRLHGFSPFTVAALQTLVEAGTATLIYGLALWTLRALPGPRAKVAGSLAALGWVFFQPAQAFSLVTMPTAWGVLAFWGVFAWSVRTQSRAAWWPWPAIGAVTGLAATAGAMALCLLPVPLVAAWRNLRRPGPFVAAVALMLAGVAAGTAPCWYHNYVVAKDPVFLSAHGGLNFWIGNNPAANGYPAMVPGLRATQAGLLKDSIATPEALAGRELKRSEVSRFWSGKAWSFIREHPLQWLGLLGLKARNFLSATEYDDLSIVNPMREEGVLTPGLRFGAAAALGLAGAALLWRRFPRSRWIVAGVALTLAGVLPVFVTERYRLLAVPGLLILGACGFAELWGALREQRWGRGVAWVGAGAAALLLTHLPQAGPAVQDWLDDCNSGRLELEAGNLSAARAKLERAAAKAPGNPDVLTALGSYWLKSRNPAEARKCYEAAIRAAPRQSTALNNLALIEMKEGQWARAQALLVAALEVEPDSIQMQQLAAYCARQLEKAAQKATPAP